MEDVLKELGSGTREMVLELHGLATGRRDEAPAPEPRAATPTDLGVHERHRRGPASPLVRLVAAYSRRARLRRGRLFTRCFGITPDDGRTILDLGGGAGDHVASVVPRSTGVVVADICPEALGRARRAHGLATLRLGDDGRIPAADASYDVVFCSSVIEHVTGPKAAAYAARDGRAFAATAREHQARFAAEIRRVARGYYVQTPYRYFLIESHSWLPGAIVLLPRSWQLAVFGVFNRLKPWPKRVNPDHHLLTVKDMRRLFPDAMIFRETSFGLTKSIIAIKT